MTLELQGRGHKGWTGRLRENLFGGGEINFALADQAIVSGANFVTTILLARYLGLEEFGRFTLAWLGLFLAQNLQISLIIVPMLTIAAKQSAARADAYRGAVTLQQIGLSLLTSGLAFGCAKLSGWLMPDWGLDQLAMPLALLVFCGQWADFFRRQHFAFSNARGALVMDLVRYGLQLGLLAAFLIGSFAAIGVSGALYLMAASAMAGSCVGLMTSQAMRFEAKAFADVLARHWVFARWLVLTAFSQWARDNFVYTAVGALLGLTEVGALRAAHQLVMVVNVPLQGMGNVAPARAAAAFRDGGFAGLRRFISTFVAGYMALIACCLIAIAFASEWLLTLVYGDLLGGFGYVVAASALIMLIYLARETAVITLRAMEATLYEFYAAAAGGAVVIAAAYPLVDGWGMPGALGTIALFEAVIVLVVAWGLRQAERGVEVTGSAAR